MTDVNDLLARATPLPWYYERGDRIIAARVGTEGHRRGVGDYALVHFYDLGIEDIGSPDANAELVTHAVNRLPDYEAATAALERLYLGMGGNRDGDHTACTSNECWWRQAKDALVALGRSVDTSFGEVER